MARRIPGNEMPSPSPSVAGVVIILGAALVGSLIIFPSRAFRRAPNPLPLRVGGSGFAQECRLTTGKWCGDWSDPSRRKRKVAWPIGTAPLGAYNKSCLWNDACNKVGVCDRYVEFSFTSFALPPSRCSHRRRPQHSLGRRGSVGVGLGGKEMTAQSG